MTKKHVDSRNGRHRSRTIWWYYVNTDCLVQQEVQRPSDTEVQSFAVVSHMGASSASSAQWHAKPWLSCFIMFIEVQSKAKKPKAFIRTGCQQNQELLDDSLVKVSEYSQLWAHFGYWVLKFFHPPALFFIFWCSYTPLSLHREQIRGQLSHDENC